MGVGIFDTQEKTKLVNINELEITKEVCQFLANLNTTNSATYFYSIAQPTLKAAPKKLWKAAQLDIESIKNLSKDELQNIATSINNNIESQLNPAVIKKTVEISSNIDELINNMELLSVSEDQAKTISSLTSKQATPAYMLQFDAGHGLSNYKEWLAHSKVDEIQLNLSIIFGKLKKQSNEKAQKAVAELIKTDQRIKTNSSVPQTVWFKYFLWRVKNNQYAL
ncbi:MAG: hypothetical protein HC932_02140 [Thermales bacterium]|nr:hypothetical protein [Thermales bacterium]